MAELNWQEVQEQKRIYKFPSGDVVIDHVIRVAISNSTHRLETADGRKYIVSSGWLCIELVMDKWSF